MTDREKVIQGLKCCQGWDDSGIYEGLHPDCDGCRKCPYSNEDESSSECHDALLCDALELLKEQEPVSPVKVNRYIDTNENGNWYVPETYDCGNCGVELYDKANYCHICGRAVKWE